MHNVNRSIAILILCFLFASTATGQDRDKRIVGDWWLWPDYTLGGNAKNVKPHQFAYPTATPMPIAKKTAPYTLFGASPTGSIATILPVMANHANPDQAFTVELWLLEHVNQPVGAAVLMHDRSGVHFAEKLTDGNYFWRPYRLFHQSRQLSLKKDTGSSARENKTKIVYFC